MDVSIIIPVFNVAPYIEDCLQSVMRQTYSGPMECLLVDDCGTDGSISIAERLIAGYAGTTLRFEIIHHDSNHGVSAARNTAIAQAKGDYIFFLDADDEITPDCIEKMMTLVKNDPNIEMVQGRYIKHFDGQQITGPPSLKVIHPRTNKEVRDCFYKGDQVSVAVWNKLMKSTVIHDNHLSFIEGIFWEDNPWTFYWLKYVKDAYFLSDVTYHYKLRPSSTITSNSAETEARYLIKCYHIILTHLTPGYEQQEVEQFVGSFIGIFLNLSHSMPELTDEWPFFWHYARHYTRHFTKLKLCTALVLCNVIGRFKWMGGFLYFTLKRLKYPHVIAKDFKSLWRNIRSKKVSGT